MNVETLNRWGDQFSGFAWPMLWQSSLLIAFLFALDWVLRRKLRAAVRYALWLVVLVKLVLPPSLAVPTSPAWWLGSQVPVRPQTTHYVVTYDNQSVPVTLPKAVSLPASVKPVLSAKAWMLMVCGAASAGLLAWLVFRWLQVIRKARIAVEAEALAPIIAEARRAAGVGSRIRVKITEDSMSPAVCGLFNPIILLPQSLAEKLSPDQMRAVLLHELIHLRRGDVWVNCAQALIQILYWWHPLVWLANARIRRAREEAVDDTVMLALQDNSDIYAPTLLEVAKFAFHRPLASLGLVGILESRSALRQRIERLVNFQAPRMAGLTIASLLGILAFTALAVPMGDAPEKPNAPSASNELQTFTMKVNPDVFIKNIKAQAVATLHATNDPYPDILLDILTGEGYDCVAPHDIAFNTKTGEITTQNTPEALDIFRYVIDQLNRPDGKWTTPGPSSFHRKNVLITAQFYKLRTSDFESLIQGLDLDNDKHGGVNWWSVSPDHFNEFGKRTKSLGLHPFNSARIQTGHGITAFLYTGTKTNSIALDCLPFITVEGTKGFVDLTVRAGTTGQFTDNPAGDWPSLNGMTNCAFNASVLAEDHGGIVLRAKNPGGSEANNLVVVLGVQIVTNNPPPAKTSERLVAIITRTDKPPGTRLGKIKTVPDPSENVPQIHIKARFIEVPEGTVKSLGMNFIPTDITNVAGFLDGPNLRLVLHTLKQRSDTEDLAEPEVTTLSCRQTQMRATKILTIITNFVFQETSTNSAITSQTAQVECGPILDTVPCVLLDGYTIDLTLIPSLTEFLGYDKTTNTISVVNAAGQKVFVPTIRPSFRVRQASTHLKLWDGQTVVLGKLSQHYYNGGKEVRTEPDFFRQAKTTKGEPGVDARELLVFITVTLVDPAGNRIHSDDEMPFAQKGIPSQNSP